MNVSTSSKNGFARNGQEFLVIAFLCNSGIAKRNCMFIFILRFTWTSAHQARTDLLGMVRNSWPFYVYLHVKAYMNVDTSRKDGFARNYQEFLVIAYSYDSGIVKWNCMFISMLRRARTLIDQARTELAGIASNLMALVGIECEEFRNWMGWIPELNDAQFGGPRDSGMCNIAE
jgi:hypothetical protein